jgi:hypothetical protein
MSKYCCKGTDGKFKDCNYNKYTAITNTNDKKRVGDDESCDTSVTTTTTTIGGGGVVTTTTTIRGGTPTTSYKVCYGTSEPIKKGCKDPGTTKGNPNPEGLIYKVQKCLGFTLGNGLDGFFGPRTEGALQAKKGRKDFMASEVSDICKDYDQKPDVKKDEPKVLTPEEQEAYWQDLVDRELISRKGTTFETKSGIMYVVKTEIDNPDVKLQIEPNSSEWDPDKADYYLLERVAPGKKTGKLKKLVYRTTVNDETKRTFQQLNIPWYPDEEMEYVNESKNQYKVFSNKLNRILKGILNEQKIGGGSNASTIQGRQNLNLQTTTTTTQQITTQGSGTQQTFTKPETTSSGGKTEGKTCREKLVDYIVASTNTEYRNEPLPGEKMAICDCYQTGMYDEGMILTKDDFLGKVTKDREGFNLLNNKLNMREIRKMFNEGKRVAGFETNVNYRDRTFLTTGCKMSDPRLKRGDLKENVKSHISEAINKKKKLTESIVNKITKKLI